MLSLANSGRWPTRSVWSCGREQNSVELQWPKPKNDGGTRIQGYRVEQLTPNKLRAIENLAGRRAEQTRLSRPPQCRTCRQTANSCSARYARQCGRSRRGITAVKHRAGQRDSRKLSRDLNLKILRYSLFLLWFINIFLLEIPYAYFLIYTFHSLFSIVAKVPEFISHIESQKTASHEEAVFSCVVDGKLPLEVKFYNYGVQVLTNDDSLYLFFWNYELFVIINEQVDQRFYSECYQL